MNDLIGNNYEPTEEQLNAKKWMKIIGVILALLFVICIALVVLMYYIQASQLKVTIDGKENAKLQDILLFEEEKIYIPIRAFAQYVGYESYNGDEKGEDKTRCYVRCANETASLAMDSDKVYKQLLNKEDYEEFTLEEPVIMKNDTLYTTIDGAKVAFNISFEYDKNQNKITIYTLPYLANYWNTQFAKTSVKGDDTNFNNQKALFYNRIVVKNADNYYGVYDLKGKEVLGTKYSNIEFIEGSKEFIVTTAEGKMGIISYDATTKITPDYNEIKQIDKEAGLYLVKNGSKQGVIDNSGKTIVYPEYDQVGIDPTKYSSSNKYDNSNIKNQYLLYDKCIPVKKGEQWGIFDKNGNKVISVEYEELGCSVGKGGSGSQTESTNNVLLVPEYEGIVVKKGGLYGLVDSQGNQLLPIALKSIYSETSAGKTTYHMLYNEQEINVIDYIKKYVKPN